MFHYCYHNQINDACMSIHGSLVNQVTDDIQSDQRRSPNWIHIITIKWNQQSKTKVKNNGLVEITLSKVWNSFQWLVQLLVLQFPGRIVMYHHNPKFNWGILGIWQCFIDTDTIITDLIVIKCKYREWCLNSVQAVVTSLSDPRIITCLPIIFIPDRYMALFGDVRRRTN